MSEAIAWAPPQPSRVQAAFLRLQARTPGWLAPAAVAVGFVGCAWWVLASDPADAGAASTTNCLVKMTTGLDCPGCGGTRAFYFLMKGNIPEAVRHHAFAVFSAPLLVWLYLAWGVRKATGRVIPMPNISAKAVSVFLAAWGVFMVLRNLPFAPFSWLYV